MKNIVNYVNISIYFSLAGMSRSVTVAVAYIMSVTDLSWKEALKVVRAGRAVANPNTGFQKQLQDFESSKLLDERKRLKERYPSLALLTKDQEQCALMLNNYEELLSSKSICEGKCVMGQVCPTGVCRQPTQKKTRRRSSRSASELSRSPSTTNVRPRSGPAGLRSYTGKISLFDYFIISKENNSYRFSTTVPSRFKIRS